MKEGITKYKVLLGIEVYEISEHFINELSNRHNVFQHLPKYTINTNEGQHNQPFLAEEFHQFVGYNPNNMDTYLYFNYNTTDRLLDSEIDGDGFEHIFKNYDFKNILSNFKPNTDHDISHFALPHTYYLVVEITYNSSYDYYNGGYDCDVDIDIIGYLDDNLEIKYFDK